jgi:hypothetical protein
MKKYNLIEKLSEQYSIPIDRLEEYISIHNEIIGDRDAYGNISIKNSGGSWEAIPYESIESMDALKSLKTKKIDNKRDFFGIDHLHMPIYGDKSDFAVHVNYLHMPIYGNSTVKIKLNEQIKEYDIEDFLKQFPSLILFVVPLYGAFEYRGKKKEVQESIKKFAVEFGNHVRKEVMVFDFWTEKDFEVSQYENQENTIMKKFNIQSNKLPAILVSNKQPFSWDPSDKSAKWVVLSFSNCDITEIGSRLLKISSRLDELQLPSKWGHNWSQFKTWCKSVGIIGIILSTT